jgi:hypothetical protein
MKTYVLFLPTDISIVYCVVLSFQMKIYVLFPVTDISIVFSVVLSIQMKTYVLFLPTDIRLSIALSVGRNSTYVFIWIEETTQ